MVPMGGEHRDALERQKFVDDLQKANKQFKKQKKGKAKLSKKVQAIFENLLNSLVNHDNLPPEKLIMTRDTRNMIWRLMLAKEGFNTKQMAKLWLLASGAANTMSMPQYQNYYYILRD